GHQLVQRGVECCLLVLGHGLGPHDRALAPYRDLDPAVVGAGTLVVVGRCLHLDADHSLVELLEAIDLVLHVGPEPIGHGEVMTLDDNVHDGPPQVHTPPWHARAVRVWWNAPARCASGTWIDTSRTCGASAPWTAPMTVTA